MAQQPQSFVPEQGGKFGTTSISGLRKGRWEYGIDFALNTGDNIPAIGLGTWKLHDVAGCLTNAINNGYRHFDFGNFDDASLAPAGDVLYKYIHSPHFGRPVFFLSSKLDTSCHHRHKAIENLEKHLRLLKCHHLDLWLMEYPLEQGGASLEETWGVMEKMVYDGKTRAIGVCNFNLTQLQRLLSFCKVPPAVLQIECQPYYQQKELIEFCNRNGIHVTAYSPFGSDEGVKQLLNDPAIQELAKKYNKTPNQIIIRWNIQNHRSVIPRAENFDHQKQNLLVFDFELKDDDLKKIASLDRGQKFVAPEKVIQGTAVGQATEKTQGLVGTR